MCSGRIQSCSTMYIYRMFYKTIGERENKQPLFIYKYLLQLFYFVYTSFILILLCIFLSIYVYIFFSSLMWYFWGVDMFVPARHAQRHLDCAPCVVVTLLQESNFYPTQDDRITTDFVFIYTLKICWKQMFLFCYRRIYIVNEIVRIII